MKEIYNRIISDTPAFFKRIIWIGISIGVACTAALAGLAQAGITISPTIDSLLQYGIVVGVVAVAIAKTAKKDVLPVSDPTEKPE